MQLPEGHVGALEETLQCAVCMEQFQAAGQRVPLILQCGHSFCSACLHGLPSRGRSCPFCQLVITGNVHSLPRNISLITLIEQVSTVMLSQSENLPLPPTASTPPRPESDDTTSLTEEITQMSLDTSQEIIKEEEMSSIARKPLQDLNINEVQSLLESSRMSKFKSAFLDFEVDGETLAECLGPEDLNELGVTLLPKCRTFYSKLEEFKKLGGVPLTAFCSESTNDTKCSTSAIEFPVHHSLSSVVVCGATGNVSSHINGLFDPTPEMESGFTVYKKRSQNVYMEFNASRGCWHIKPKEHRGTTRAWLYVTGPCAAPLNFVSSSHVWNGEKFEVQMDVKFKPFVPSIKIAGCVGAVASQVNGTYNPTDEVCGGLVRYLKSGNAGHWLEYNGAKAQWQIKPAKSKGTSTAWAYLACSSACYPEKEKQSIWHCYEDSGSFSAQPQITTIEEPSNVYIQGARGHSSSSYVNGVYDATDEVCDGYIRYKHKVKPSWLEYNSVRTSWHVKSAESKNTTNAWAYATCPVPMAPEKHPSEWHCLADGNDFVPSNNVSILPESYPVTITAGFNISLGQAGLCNKLNGIYEPIGVCGGWHRYKKQGEDFYLEYCASRNEWQLKPGVHKDAEKAWAFVHCSEACSPLETSSTWRVYDPETKKFSSCDSMLLTQTVQR